MIQYITLIIIVKYLINLIKHNVKSNIINVIIQKKNKNCVIKSKTIIQLKYNVLLENYVKHNK